MAKIHFADDFTSQISQIISPKFDGIGGLYLGNLNSFKNQEILKKYKISAILSIVSQVQLKNVNIHLKHFQIKLDDSPFQKIGQYFEVCYQFIDKNIKFGNVLVHCIAGISRSATLVTAYLMKAKKYNLKHALQKVRSKRKVVNPNKGFVIQLQQFQKKLEKVYKYKLN